MNKTLAQTPMEINVFEAALQRLNRIFDDFDNVYVSFSGGKDSGVLLNLALIVARQRGRKIGVFHIDYEAQYTATTDYVDATYADLAGEVENLRCCVPLKCPTCTSMHETHWRPWDPEKQALWVRPLPPAYLDAHHFDFITPETSDYDFQSAFSRWHHTQKGAQRTCVLVGIRAQESLDRWRTIVSERNINKFDRLKWTTKVGEGIYNAYPIYDWSVEDIWAANAQHGWRYNALYDLMHYAGIPLHAQRVASPFHNAAKSSLSLYRAIDPHVWGKMVSRVNGVNFTAIYGDTKAMGWRNISKPAHFTWQEYARFLLDTLPPETAENFRAKLATSIEFWRKKGGVLSEEAQADLQKAGIPFSVGKATNYRTNKMPVTMEYADEIDSKDFRLIPTWKRLCVCILKNDHVGKYMGFNLTKAEMQKRTAAIEKYKNL
jgi:predicted phosphoadenosine phosphosulfate sulfurtransferase